MRRSVSISVGCCFVLLVAGLTGAVAVAAGPDMPATAGPDMSATAGPSTASVTGTGVTGPAETAAIVPIPHDPQVDSEGFDRSVFEIRIHQDGRGVWTLRYERVLESTQEREDFETFAERFRSEETDLYRGFRADATGLVSAGENTTDRQMAADGFGRDAFVRSTIGNDIGVVELQFTWHGFGVVEGDTVTVGDVFEGGFYIGPNQELVFTPGESVAFQSIEPAGTQSNPESLTDSASVTWEGERQFTDRRPWATVEHVNATPTGTTAESGSSGTADASSSDTDREQTGSNDGTLPGSSGGSGGSGDDPGWAALGMVLGIIVLLLGAIAWQRRDGVRSEIPTATDASAVTSEDAPPTPEEGPAATGGGTSTETIADGTSTGTTPGSMAPGETAEGADPNGTHDHTGTPGGDARSDPETDAIDDPDTDTTSSPHTEPETTAPAITDEELLSDEDRVVRILHQHGGRVKQSRIVDETDWSKSKVSVLLSEMTDEGTVSKLRVGRENVVSLEGHEPDIAGSPFDDDSTGGDNAADGSPDDEEPSEE